MPLPESTELHQFIGDTRARLKALEENQRELRDSLVLARTDSAAASERLAAALDVLKTEVTSLKVKIAFASALASMAGATIAGLLIKYA